MRHALAARCIKPFGQLLAEATWQALRRSPTVRSYFERVQRKDPQRKKIALVATAHYLIRVMYTMFKHGTLWRVHRGLLPRHSDRDAFDLRESMK